MEVREINIENIAVSAQNTRKRLQAGEEDSSLEDLARSIQQKGLLSPIVVRGMGPKNYELIAGQRRLLACKKLYAGRRTLDRARRETKGSTNSAT